jgi:hypothetical protein
MDQPVQYLPSPNYYYPSMANNELITSLQENELFSIEDVEYCVSLINGNYFPH